MKKHYAVIGAGAFGGWTAYHLLKAGAKVTLFDAWGAGNTRASSGGESRIIRAVYGKDGIYTRMVVDAFKLWHQFEKEQGVQFYHRTGCLWMFSTADNGYMHDALPHMAASGFTVEPLEIKEVANRFPMINTGGIQTAFWEAEAGWLPARQATEQVARVFAEAGGDFQRKAAMPGSISAGTMSAVILSDGSKLQADGYIFACGPWLPKLFPELLKGLLQVNKQEAYFFSTPAGDQRFQFPNLPIWIDLGKEIFYGIPSTSNLRGFKIADDMRLATFDPDTEDRVLSADRLQMARNFLARRFPDLAKAPLQESRICQYTNSSDGHLLIDRHPEAENVWIAGAGSGHGFKLGPAVGQFLADLVFNNKKTKPEFTLDRPDRGQKGFTQIRPEG